LAALRPKVVLCDADGNLFPSEEPAFDASVVVTRRFLADHGISVRLDPDALRRETTGRNFRTTARDLAASHGVAIDDSDLEQWVREEREVVSRHLAATLRPDDAVREPLARLAERFLLAAVSSSASARLAACFAATGLDRLIPPDRRFSSEDSLARPTSKPDPAVYRHACRVLGLSPREAVAIEDSVPGVQSAYGAGITTIGNVHFVPEGERPQRAEQLIGAGAATVVGSWAEVESLLPDSRQMLVQPH
jgi:HAD superfamily hydrolase (TIGR01509 family)